jgi:thiol-disulfide isomerase/thioredoxin
MKTLIFSFLLFSLTVLAQNHPIAGENFNLVYDPFEKGVFGAESNLSVVYVFDYWGTKVSYMAGSEGLFQNVLNPDEGRKLETTMDFVDGKFSARIMIPESAQILSYYITDGNNFDYNDRKTFVNYIYDKSGSTVKGARFRNVDFLIMAGAETDVIIKELEDELAAFPEDYLVRSVLWEKRFLSKNNLDDILSVRAEFEKEFSELKKDAQDNYDLLNAEARIYSSFQMALSNHVMQYYQESNNKIIELALQIPDGKRSSVVERIYQAHLQQQRSAKFTEDVIGKPLLDFDFSALTGEKKKLSDFKGKVILLDFWGTWCGPCVAEIPNLIKVYNKYKSLGFEIISVSSDLMMNSKTQDEFKLFVEQKNMDWTHTLDDKNQTIHRLYEISHWPTLYLIDKTGVIVKNENVLRGSLLEKTLDEIFASEL